MSTGVGKALLPTWEADAAMAQGRLLETSSAVRRVLASMSTEGLRRFVRAARAQGGLDMGRTAQGVFIPLGTMCAEYQARKRELEKLLSLTESCFVGP